MKKVLLSSIVLAALFTGCGSSSSCCSADASGVLEETSANVPPVAAITGLANNTRISTSQSVSVNGATSSDRDGTVSTYSWSINDVASSETGANPTFTFDEADNYEICLTVTDNDSLNSANTECRTVIVEEPIVVVIPPAPTPLAPTAVITLSNSDAPLIYGSNHNFSCAGSYDNDTLGTGDEIVACNWTIQSYKIVNGVETPYRNCTADVMANKSIHICGNVTKIVATLTVTDNDGQENSTTTEYTSFSQ